MGGCHLDPKKSRREIFQQIFALGPFWGGVSSYAATSLIVALSPGHSDITRFRPWSSIVPDRKSFGSRRKNSKRCSDDWNRWRFLSAFRLFGTNFAESFRMSKSSRMMDQTHSREMPSCSAIDLDEIRRLSKSSSWNLINNLRGGHCFGSSRTRRITGGKIITFKLDHPVFDGGIRWWMFP